MGIKVEITNAPHRGGKTIQVTSGEGFEQFRSTTIVTPYMSMGMRFEDMIDNLVRYHCHQKATAEYRAWKEGR